MRKKDSESFNILTVEGFYFRFLEVLPDCKNGRQAYYKVCEEVETRFDVPPRYTSYESFKSNYHRHHKKRKRESNSNF